MKTLVDDFSTLAVERGLLLLLPVILSPETILPLKPETIALIASESEESKLQRARANEKLRVLESTLVILRSLDKHKPRGEQCFSYSVM